MEYWPRAKKMRAHIGYIIYKASTQQRTKQYNTTDLN